MSAFPERDGHCSAPADAVGRSDDLLVSALGGKLTLACAANHAAFKLVQFPGLTGLLTVDDLE